MNNNHKISIVIPSFNQGRYIEQTIISILNQDYDNVELIIIDAGSTDETVSIIKKYERRIDYWVSEPDRGQAHAINKGLAKATGDIFNWINSDDFLEPGALQEIGAYFMNHPDKNMLCGYTRCFFDADNSTSHEYRMGVKEHVASTILQVEMNQPGSFYRLPIVKELGGVNESLRYVFDDELWFRYLCKYGQEQIGFSSKRFAQFRLHGTSKSIGEGFELFNKEIQRLYIEIAKKLDAPTWMITKMNDQPITTTYSSNVDWEVSSLNKPAFLGYFAAKYLNSLYVGGDNQSAKEALHLAIYGGHFKWNRMMISLRLKLLFS